MRRTIATALIALLWTAPAWAQTYVKDAAFSSGTTCVTYTGSFTPTNAGDTLAVCACSAASITNPVVTSLSDNNGGSWTLQATAGNAGAAGFCAVATAPNHASGATTITVTDTAGSGNCGQSAIVYEFKNTGKLTLDQQVANLSAGSGSVWSTGTTGTLAQVTELAIACFVDFANGSTIATSSGPTNGFSQASSNNTQDAAGLRNTNASTFKVTTSSAAVSTQLTASAAVPSSVSLLVTLEPGAIGKSWVSGD